VRGWLFAIAARKAVDAHRRREREPEPVADVEQAAAQDPPADRGGDVWLLVRSLPGKQRTAVALRYLADLSHAEIAAAMGTSEDAARRNVFEGLRRLRELVGPSLEGAT
jgi:RNA polymerase sigma factor (sigma-70 family)